MVENWKSGGKECEGGDEGGEGEGGGGYRGGGGEERTADEMRNKLSFSHPHHYEEYL